jgi:pyridoxal phosphate enzyme (YggS family)
MASVTPSTLEARFLDVRSRIARAAKDHGRDPSAITLIAVAKGHGPAAIEAAIAQGQRDFGENRVQEAEAKWPALKAKHPGLKLHLVGSLQTNKLKPALKLFDCFHALDRPRLADKLLEARSEAHPLPPLFIQVNTGEEPQKAGVWPADADPFIEDCLKRGLPVVGLMCVPPLHEERTLHFALLAKIAARHGLTQLSMGMSDDFEAAIAFGATHLRIGTALFGPRPEASDASRRDL